ncbi:hypothetical protein AMTRI_Chr08g166090 [Amborella trichopoda]
MASSAFSIFHPAILHHFPHRSTQFRMIRSCKQNPQPVSLRKRLLKQQNQENKAIPKPKNGVQTQRNSEQPASASSSSAIVKKTSWYSFLGRTAAAVFDIRNAVKADELGLQIASIALPALLALAADPIASLVDTAFVGHVGSVELAAVGVSISVFNLVSKLFNIPLLNITTSFVAEEHALMGSDPEEVCEDDGVASGPVSLLQENVGPRRCKKFLPAVSASLALAAAAGIAEAIALSCGSEVFLNFMGIPVDSPMHLPANHFLKIRALGAPPVVIAMAAQGAFRGFMDTKSPLYAIVAGNLLNMVLDPILMFIFGLGIGGAAIATVFSEYLIALFLLWELNSKVILVPTKIETERFARYQKSGSLLIGRTVAILSTMTLGTAMAARQGPVPMAGHQICLEVWFTISLLTDSLALAGQALLARVFAQGDYEKARQVIYRVLQIALATGIVLAIALFVGFGTFSSLFTTDSCVLEIAYSVVVFVAGSQPINAIAFVFDGLYYGVSDFAYAAYSMVWVGLISSLFLLVAAPAFGLTGIWGGLVLFMFLRGVAGFWRMGTEAGPWQMIWSEMEREMVDK